MARMDGGDTPGLVFVDPPAKQHNRGGSVSVMDEVAKSIMHNPGRWAMIDRVYRTQNSADSSGRHIVSRHKHLGRWEKTTRLADDGTARLWLRFYPK